MCVIVYSFSQRRGRKHTPSGGKYKKKSKKPSLMHKKSQNGAKRCSPLTKEQGFRTIGAEAL